MLELVIFAFKVESASLSGRGVLSDLVKGPGPYDSWSALRRRGSLPSGNRLIALTFSEASHPSVSGAVSRVGVMWPIGVCKQKRAGWENVNTDVVSESIPLSKERSDGGKPLQLQVDGRMTEGRVSQSGARSIRRNESLRDWRVTPAHPSGPAHGGLTLPCPSCLPGNRHNPQLYLKVDINAWLFLHYIIPPPLLSVLPHCRKSIPILHWATLSKQLLHYSSAFSLCWTATWWLTDHNMSTLTWRFNHVIKTHGKNFWIHFRVTVQTSKVGIQ